MSHFGWKAVIGILISNVLYWAVFRREFAALRKEFELRALKETILTEHLAREEMEREIDAINAEVTAELGFRDKLVNMVEKFRR